MEIENQKLYVTLTFKLTFESTLLIRMMLLLSSMLATFLIFFLTRITAVKLFNAILQQISAQLSYGAVYCVLDLCCTYEY